ncbi:MAG TPA: DNA-protecting protein DprA, partial [Caulobacteraceae bacterium]
TARLAGEQGREVFAVPGSPLDPRARGANGLLRQGATLVEEVDDVLQVLDAQPGFAEPGPSEDLAGGPEPEALSDAAARRLEALLSAAPARLDDLARDAGAAPAAVAAALVELSLAGRVELLPGGYVVRR